MNYPADVRLVEVGPRDGLQNESVKTDLEFRTELVNRLSACGFRTLEVGSFVSPKWVPQMAGTSELLNRVNRSNSVSLVALVPNLQGMRAAIESKVDEVAIFTAASETFSQKNINCSIAESFDRFAPVVELAKNCNIPIRGYISCALGCPYEGQITVEQVTSVVERLLKLGCYEVSIGDTIGVGTTSATDELLRSVLATSDAKSIAVHFHDTYGQALPNILTALNRGISIIDCSIGGLGGCPYAKGAGGNVATEDVVYMLNGMEVRTGVNLEDLIKVNEFVFSYLQKKTSSRVALATMSKQN